MKVIDILGIRNENAEKYGAVYSNICKYELWIEIIENINNIWLMENFELIYMKFFEELVSKLGPSQL